MKYIKNCLVNFVISLTAELYHKMAKENSGGTAPSEILGKIVMQNNYLHQI